MPIRATMNNRSAKFSKDIAFLIFSVLIDAKEKMHEIVNIIAIIEVNSSIR